MQSGGQYGLSEMQQFVLGRAAPRLYGQDLAAAQSPQLRQQVQQLQHHHHHAQQQPQQQQQQQQQVHQHHHLAQQHAQQHAQFQPHQQLLQQSLSLAHQHHRQVQSPNQQQQHHQHQHHVQLLVPGSNSPDMATPPVSTPRPPASNSNTRPLVTEKDASLEDDGAAEDGERGGSCNRWPIEETISLLRIRSEMDAFFRDSGVKGPLWEEVSRKLGELGYHRSARKCKEKFENVHKYYKKTKDGKAGRQDGKSYRFFTELEALYSSPTNTNLNSDSNGPHTLLKACITQGYGGTTDQEGLPTATIPATAGTSSGLNRSSDSSSQNGDDNDEENENDNEEEEEEDDDDNDNHEDQGYELDGGVEKCEEEGRSNTIRKRKRRSWSGMKAFFEKLVKQVTKQQEALHKKFLETIERLDQERVMREEAYRRQEEARLNREHELRAQEHAMAATRDAALVAFLQKITGHSLNLPHMPPPPSIDPHHELDLQDKELSDFTAKRWPKVEVHALIRIRSGMEPRFQEAGPKAQLWEEISASMGQMGYHRSAKRCKEKWENINKYFRKTKDSCKKRPENAKTCPYFHYLDTLYQKGILNSPNSNKCGNKGEGQSDNLMENSREDDDHMIQDGSDAAEMMAIVNSGGESNPGILTGMEDVTDHGAAHVANIVTTPHKHSVMETNDNPPAPPALNFNGFEGLSNKSLKMEGFVKEILDLQQQQHQKLMEEYERMEHAREIRDQERRQQQQEIHLSQQRAPSSTRDNAALMALVHKLASEPSDFRMVGSSSPG